MVHLLDIFNFIFLQKLPFIFSRDKATLIFRPVISYTKMQKNKGNFTLLAVRRTENTRQSSFSSFVKFVSLKSLIFIIISTVASTWSRVCFTPHTHRKTSTLSKRPFPPSILLSFVQRGNFFSSFGFNNSVVDVAIKNKNGYRERTQISDLYLSIYYFREKIRKGGQEVWIGKRAWSRFEGR